MATKVELRILKLAKAGRDPMTGGGNGPTRAVIHRLNAQGLMLGHTITDAGRLVLNPPKNPYPVGKVLWSVYVDEETGQVEFWEYVVRTIRGGFIYTVHKCESTWGKRSKKHGDFGWLDPIEKMWRTKWRYGEEPPRWKGFGTTKLLALKYEIDTLDKDDFVSDEAYEKAKKTLGSMLTRETNAKKKK